jgi:hypothetical protein
MGIQRSVYEIYGVRLPDDTDHFALEVQIGQCNSRDERAGVFTAGEYDNNMVFLAVTWRELDPGEYSHSPTLVGGFDEERYSRELDWNHELTTTANQLGLKVLEGPGWFTISDEA